MTINIISCMQRRDLKTLFFQQQPQRLSKSRGLLADLHSLELPIFQANADFTKTDFTFVDQISDLDLP